MTSRLLACTVAVLALLGATAGVADASRMPAPPRVTIHENTPCPYDNHHVRSCAAPSFDGDVYLSPGASRHERFHEIGHIFDFELLTAADRLWLTDALGYPPGTIWSDGGDGEWTTENHRRQPAEAFAETYADCALDWVPAHRVVRDRDGKRIRVIDVTEVSGRSDLLSLTVRQYRRVCNAIVLIALVRAPVQ